jgi:very-short-patch-repair endonuclease
MDSFVLRVIAPLAVLAALIGIAWLVAALGRRRRSSAPPLDRPWPLECEPQLLSEPEQILYRRLVQAAPEHIVLAQVQLQQMVRFRRGAQRAGIRNRFSQLCVDFVIVKPDTSIVAAVELDDASHLEKQRRAADARKAHALESAGIPLLRWHVRQMPSVKAIQANLALIFRRAS